MGDGSFTGSAEAVKLLSPNQHQMNTTVSIVGTKAHKTPWVGASETMWNRIDPWNFGGCRSLVRRRLMPQTMIASVTATMLGTKIGSERREMGRDRDESVISVQLLSLKAALCLEVCWRDPS